MNHGSGLGVKRCGIFANLYPRPPGVAAYWSRPASEGIPDRPGLDAGADGPEGVSSGASGTMRARTDHEATCG